MFREAHSITFPLNAFLVVSMLVKSVPRDADIHHDFSGFRTSPQESVVTCCY